MGTIDKLKKMEQLDFLIRTKKTGPPEELAEKLDISERQTRRYIEEMKEIGAAIQYNRYLFTYEYLKPLMFKFGFFEEK